jgi:hypothetical protein
MRNAAVFECHRSHVHAHSLPQRRSGGWQNRAPDRDARVFGPGTGAVQYRPDGTLAGSGEHHITRYTAIDYKKRSVWHGPSFVRSAMRTALESESRGQRRE